MNLSVVRLIAAKETRDLLRDRRTVLLILLLPIVLYPLFGTAGLVFARSMLGQPSVVGIVGIENLPKGKWPPLLAPGGTAFADKLFEGESEIGAPIVQPLTDDSQAVLKSKAVDVVLIVPAGFAEQLEQGKEKPRLILLSRDGDEKAKLTLKRVSQTLAGWERAVKRERFKLDGKAEDYDRQFTIDDPQKAKPPEKKAADELRDTFVRMFPFILFVWVVAGAIQPAVDLTAGEKERGTMETLLISPAERSEIVLGKFFAVTAFGFASVVWNVIWLTVAGAALGGFLGFPVINVPGMLACVVLGVPITMLFSAVSLALGVFARSTKEGQYYLMPLMLCSMPLAFWSMMPGVELTPSMSIVPVTGAMLLQQKMLAISGDPIPWLYFAPVLGSLFVYVAIALGLAIWQFNRESVLFRETGPAKTRGGWFRKSR